MAKRLTHQQQVFISEYVTHWNGTKAAIAAGYSKDSAASQASRLLRNVKVLAEIERRKAEFVMQPGEVLGRLTQIARADIDDILKEDAEVPLLDMKRARELTQTGLVKSFTVSKNGIKFELHDKMKALELLGKHHALFTDRVEVEDWRTKAIADIRAGTITYEALAEAFDADLATQLFAAAGVPVQTGKGT